MKYGKEHALCKYQDDYPEKAINILSKGKSYAALAASLDVSVNTLNNWSDTYPEFKEAIEIGKAKGQAFWEEDSDVNMHNKDYSSVRYIFKMKSQYKVRDGSEGDKNENPAPSTHFLFGMDGQQHTELATRILQQNNPGE